MVIENNNDSTIANLNINLNECNDAFMFDLMRLSGIMIVRQDVIRFAFIFTFYVSLYKKKKLTK